MSIKEGVQSRVWYSAYVVRAGIGHVMRSLRICAIVRNVDPS